MGTGTETRTVADMRTGTTITGTGTRIDRGGQKRDEKAQKSAKKLLTPCGKRGDAGVQRKNEENKGLVQ